MKLVSLYYSPSMQRMLTISNEEIEELDHEFMLNTMLQTNYELIGYFYDN